MQEKSDEKLAKMLQKQLNKRPDLQEKDIIDKSNLKSPSKVKPSIPTKNFKKEFPKTLNISSNGKKNQDDLD